jgi:hypothetical protein
MVPPEARRVADTDPSGEVLFDHLPYGRYGIEVVGEKRGLWLAVMDDDEVSVSVDLDTEEEEAAVSTVTGVVESRAGKKLGGERRVIVHAVRAGNIVRGIHVNQAGAFTLRIPGGGADLLMVEWRDDDGAIQLRHFPGDYRDGDEALLEIE